MISPNKIKNKRILENIMAKIEVINKANDKKNVKEENNDKNDKNVMSKDKMNKKSSS